MDAGMISKKRVCFVIPSLEAGGMERVMSEIVNYSAKQKDLQVDLILFGRPSKIVYHIDKNVNLIQNTSVSNNKIVFLMQILFFLRKNVKANKPNSILSFGEIWNNFVLLALLGLKVNIFISDRSHPNSQIGFFHENLRKLLYPRAKGFIAQTAYALNIKKRKINLKKTQVIPNPLYTIPKIEDLVNDSDKENIILNVGRYSKIKNQEFLIRTFIKINDKNWKLYIVGDNHAAENLKEKFEKIIDDAGFKENIKLIGFTDIIGTYYKRAKIFAFPSFNEGYPNVVCEALAHSVPILSFVDGVSHSELIVDGCNGIIVDNRDEAAYESELKSLMYNDELRNKMSLVCRESIKKLEKNLICNDYIDFIIM